MMERGNAFSEAKISSSLTGNKIDRKSGFGLDEGTLPSTESLKEGHF